MLVVFVARTKKEVAHLYGLWSKWGFEKYIKRKHVIRVVYGVCVYSFFYIYMNVMYVQFVHRVQRKGL